jgi:hypothetical protein
VVGAATLHNEIASQFAAGDDLPCADVKLLVPLKRSAEFAAIRRRVADHHHLDSWQDDDLHFFVFLLHPKEGVEADPKNPPVAVFAMHPEIDVPLSAVVVTPKDRGVQAEIQDINAPDEAYTAPIPSAFTTGNGSNPK